MVYNLVDMSNYNHGVINYNLGPINKTNRIEQYIQWHSIMQLKRFQVFVDSDAAVTATHTTENTEISHNFIMWKFCGKAQFPQSFGRIAQLGELRETLWKLCFSPKFPHQEIR